MIHHKKNHLLYKDATCQFLAMWFHWCYCFFFSVLFGIALLLLFLHILPSMAFTLLFFFFFFFYQVLFHGLYFFFKGTFLPWLVLFLAVSLAFLCPVLLGGVLALCRAPISSNWFFVWHSLGPSSTQLLVRNRSGFCSHRYLAGLIFLQNISFYRLCFSLAHCFSFKWFCSF